MAVNLSPIWGAGAQLLDNSGNVLSGGKIYTYAAGTTTPAATYTSSNGITANSNPIILNSAGRVVEEIWLTDGISYKFVLKDSNDTLIATYDNLNGINSNFIAYTAQQEIQTATAGQTVFNLTTMQYQPGTNNLAVYVDGVNQYGPGAQYAFVETDSDTVTFVSGLHVGASVKFTTASPVSSASTNAENVAYDPPFTGAVATNVEAKLAQYVSVKDFGAVGDGVTDDTQAIQDAIDSQTNGGTVYFPNGDYLISDTIKLDISGIRLVGDGADSPRVTWGNWPTRIVWDNTVTSIPMFEIDSTVTGLIKGGQIENIVIDAQNATGVSPLTTNPSNSQWYLHKVIFRNYNESIFIARSCVGWTFDEVYMFGAETVSIVLEGPAHNTTFNHLIVSNTGLVSTVDCAVRVGGNDRSSNINFNYCDFEAQDHTYQVELLDCRAVNVNGGYAEPQGGTAVFKLGSTSANTACNGFTMSGFFVQGGAYDVDYIVDVELGAAINIGSGNHFRFVKEAVVNCPANAANSNIDYANYLFNVGGAPGTAVLFDNKANGWQFFENGTTLPTVVGGTIAGSNTYTTQFCRYYVVNDMVYYDLEIELSNLASTGFLTIDTKIPYVSRTNTSNFPVTIGEYSGFSLAAGSILLAYHTPNSNTISLREQIGTGSGQSTVLNTEASNTMKVVLSGWYPIL